MPGKRGRSGRQQAAVLQPGDEDVGPLLRGEAAVGGTPTMAALGPDMDLGAAPERLELGGEGHRAFGRVRVVGAVSVV